jgi:hypothetical protein
MKRYRYVALLVITTASVSWAQFSLFSFSTSLSRKGSIENAWVDPANPTTGTQITLYVSTADQLDLDRIETGTSWSGLTVKVYWQDPASGDGAGPSQAGASLGTLAQGSHRVTVQSYYAGRWVGTKRVSFDVAEALVNDQSDCIDEIWVEPVEPVAWEPTTLYVSGEWPTAGYSLDVSATSILGNNASVRMHWTPPTGPVAQVITPYEKQVSLNNLAEGTATVKVECYLDGTRVDWAEMSFEVQPGEGSSSNGWPWDWSWPW